MNTPSPSSEMSEFRGANAPGVFVAVVGPSGAGKDTLMNAARAALADDPRIVFVRRAITRPAEAGGEDHAAFTDADFRACAAGGGFALAWGAHGLHYGIPAAVRPEIDAGRVVVANLSRTAIGDAERAFGRVAVIEITAPIAVLAARLAARGRESAADITARLAREAPVSPTRAPLNRIVNDGRIADSAAELVHLLRTLADPA